MTAIYAYAGCGTEGCFIAADDFDNISKKKRDKVLLLGDKFALAFLGQEFTKWAAESLEYYLRVTNASVFPSFDEVVRSIRDLLKCSSDLLYPKYCEAYNRGEIKKEDWQALHDQPSIVVILDLERRRLFRCDFGRPFPSNKIETFAKVHELHQGKLSLHSLARVAAGIDYLDYKYSSIADHYNFLRQLIREHRKQQSLIGDLGTYIHMSESGDLEKKSAFSSPVDYLDNMYSEHLLGFQLLVVRTDK